MVITSTSFAYDEGIKQHGRGNRVWTRRSADLHGFMYLWCKRGLRLVGVGRLQWHLQEPVPPENPAKSDRQPAGHMAENSHFPATNVSVKF